MSVTQQFNTTTSMGRLTLNVLLSFAQFEREVIGERIRDKIAASKKKGMWSCASASGRRRGVKPSVSPAEREVGNEVREHNLMAEKLLEHSRLPLTLARSADRARFCLSPIQTQKPFNH